MTKEQEALKLALEALTIAALAKLEDGTYLDKNCQMTTAITAIHKALAQPAQEPQVCCGEYDTCLRACTPRGRYLAQPEERNFCQRCGKPVNLTTIHTCTPPRENT
jgi:hypothetical protein